MDSTTAPEVLENYYFEGRVATMVPKDVFKKYSFSEKVDSFALGLTMLRFSKMRIVFAENT